MFDIQFKCHPTQGARQAAKWLCKPVGAQRAGLGSRKINRSHERLRGAASCPGLPRPSVRRKPGCVSSEEGRLRPAETSAEATFSGRKWILLSLQQRPDSGWKKSRALCQGSSYRERGVWLMEPFATTSEPRSVWRMPVCLSKGWTV